MLHTHRTMVISQVGPKTKARLRVFSRARFRTRTGDPLLTMRSNRQPVATLGNGFGLFPPFSGTASCDRLPPVAAAGLHKDEMWWDPLGTGVLEHAGRSRPWSSRRSRCGSYVRLMF